VCVYSGHCHAACQHDARVLRVSIALHCTAVPEDRTEQERREEERVEQNAEQGRDWDWAARYAGGSLRGQQDILSSIF
jgi:hypothetical protein